ncbi:hypothetical protein ACFFRE_03320 [Aciditerrimonas ferrireducens]|jgi:hypothetical protein|uniref:Uncharacterized protein n=1 Tax=Aciditerrimonas ferrireducens TaxID=667306 RepID=A0ABV6C0I0_9ACTN|nr:hypothetical protein [Aciditerrimonas ferrireducens]MCK4177446.1 hypothetical protein [Aciditerrimonas ferrireducens]
MGKRSGAIRWAAAAGLGAATLSAAGVVGGLASGVAGAASLSCASQLSGSNNLCVVGSNGVLTVTPAASLNTSPLVIHGVANAMLGTLSSNGTTSFPASGAQWVSGLQGTLAGITASISIQDDGTATGTYDPSTGQVSLSGNLRVSLSAPTGPCTYTQPFQVSGSLGSPSASGGVYTATGTVTQASTPVDITNDATGSGCGVAESVLKGATQTLSLPVTAYTTVNPSTITASSSSSTSSTPTSSTPSSSTPSSSTPSTSASGTVPSASTGEPWSGWTWWAAIGGVAVAGAGLLVLGSVRRRGVSQRS